MNEIIRIRKMKCVSVNEIALLLSQDEIKNENCICMTTAERKKAIKIDDERHLVYNVELELIEFVWNELLKMLKA